MSQLVAVDYTMVRCPFCSARVGQPCVKVRGPNRGEVYSQYHTARGYAWWAAKPVKRSTPTCKCGQHVCP